MNQRPSYVSVTDPISPAIDRAKTMLFRPFDLGRWFAIGFCAWLANLGTAGGPNGGINVNLPGAGKPRSMSIPDVETEIKEAIATVKSYMAENIHWILPLAVVIVLSSVALWLLFTWLSSRGRFMFLHCVVHDRDEIADPWNRFRRHGNSLFLFRVVLGLVGFVLLLIAALPGILLTVSSIADGQSPVAVFRGIATLILLVSCVSIPLWLTKKFTDEFVVPIMFLRTASSRAGWREFLSILSQNKARFLLYVLFQIVIAMVISFIIMAAICVTCCIAGCIMSIPYLGTVLLLPILVFSRSYSLYYLRQYGPDFDVFIPQAQSLDPPTSIPPQYEY